jgi:hypothetical protein
MPSVGDRYIRRSDGTLFQIEQNTGDAELGYEMTEVGTNMTGQLNYATDANLAGRFNREGEGASESSTGAPRKNRKENSKGGRRKTRRSRCRRSTRRNNMRK